MMEWIKQFFKKIKQNIVWKIRDIARIAGIQLGSETRSKMMPISFSFQKGSQGKSHELLVPYLDGSRKGFRNLTGGSSSDFGLIAYSGREVTASDLVIKMKEKRLAGADDGETLNALEHYLSELQNFKLGNVIRVEYNSRADFGFRLVKEANSPPKDGKIMQK